MTTPTDALHRAADLIVGGDWWEGLTVGEIRVRAERVLDPRQPLDGELLRTLRELPDEVRL